MKKINYNFENVLTKDLKISLIQLLNNSKSNQILTFNLDNFKDAHFDEKYLDAVKDSEYVTIDGMGLKLLLKLKHRVNYYVITGTDIFIELLSISNEQKLRVGLIGGTNEVQELVKNKIFDNFPNVKISLNNTPQKGFEKDDELNNKVISCIQNSNSDILFVALGAPRQEKWIKDILPNVNVKIIVGIGSVFDTFSEKIKRAPLIFRKFGFEWLWRLFIEPKRMFKRYIINDFPFFIKYLMSSGKN